jgi:hypothetical protein
MKIYEISLGHIIPIEDGYFLLRSNNNKWSIIKNSIWTNFIKSEGQEVSLDILKEKSKRGAIKCLFEGFK